MRTGRSPRELDVDGLQQELMLDDCYIPYKTRRLSPLTAEARTNAEVLRDGVDRNFGEEQHCWRGGKGDAIEYSFEQPRNRSCRCIPPPVVPTRRLPQSRRFPAAMYAV